MNKKFYISDWHYGHKNVLKFDNRPFYSVDEMNQELITRWNNVVDKSDMVYVLGDMFWCNAEEAIPVLEQLNGNKFLVKGNHDRCHDTKFKKHFNKIDEYMEVEDNGHNIVLCHYPIPCFKNHYYGQYHFYGHVHNTKESKLVEKFQKELIKELNCPCNMYNVGAMMPYMNYTPRTFDEIIEGSKLFRYLEVV